MSGLIKKPKNINTLQPSKYSVSFPEISDTIYFCQKINLPGVQLTEMPHVTPNLDLYVPGTKMIYETLEMQFIVNEDLSSWLAIHNWIRGISTDMGYRTKPRVQAILTIYSNQNNPKMRIKYADVFPLSLGEIEFDTTTDNEHHLISNATFRFNYFDIERIA
jgi:hypothetical protein